MPGGSGYPRTMPDIPARDLPPIARAAWMDLRDQLLDQVGDDLVALWAHGGTTNVDDAVHVGDLDTYVILRRQPGEATVGRIDETHAGIADVHGIEWDAWYVLEADARRSEPPTHAWIDGRRDTSWAIHRAHWLAGRYVNLHGADPREIVTPPTWDQLRGELDRELEHIERHVMEGDTDSYEATYAVLTGGRILHALATRNVVMSKPAAGSWALEHLPDRWHAALGAALRSYSGGASPVDAELLAAEMAPFVSFVRSRLPPETDRPPGALPRWSGY